LEFKSNNDLSLITNFFIDTVSLGEGTPPVPGPEIIMREPWVENDDVHTGASGVDSVQIMWSEAVLFDSNDVNIIDEEAIDVPFSISGNNSQQMIITFGEVLLNDKYTITIHDTVKSAASPWIPIDGDKDGLAGGDAILVMEHRERLDSDNDNDVDLFDFAQLAEKWLWSE
jgi:hypothetical protein